MHPFLTSEHSFWLSRLRKDLTVTDDIEKMAKEYRKKRNSPLYSAVMDVLMRANHDTIEEAKYMCDAIRELFADELREGIAKGVAEGLERGKAWGLERGIAITKMVLRMDAQGKSVDEIAKGM